MSRQNEVRVLFEDCSTAYLERERERLRNLSREVTASLYEIEGELMRRATTAPQSAPHSAKSDPGKGKTPETP